METARPQNRRVLVVVDDRILGEELRGTLVAAGLDAEAVSLGAGLTPEFLDRLAPGLVLLELAAGGPRREAVRALVSDLRQRTGCRLLVVGHPGPELDDLARRMGADGAVDRARLALDPHAVLGTRAPHPSLERPVPPPLPPPKPKPTAPPEILSMIEEELARLQAAPAAESVQTWLVNVDLFSEHNFYVSKTATGRLVGLFVATSLPPPVGTLVKLSISLHGERWIQTRGEVAWVRERSVVGTKLVAGAGVRMLDLRDSEKQLVRQFLAQRAPYSYTGD